MLLYVAKFHIASIDILAGLMPICGALKIKDKTPHHICNLIEHQ
jgi:hypothetical protein